MASRSVRFSQDAMVHTIPSCQDLEDKEWSLLWYAPEDYINFSDQCEASAKRLEDDSLRFHSKRSSPSYGLENWTKDGFRKCMRNRMDSVHVVLEEQFAQWGEGLDDSDSIAELYSARCQHVEMVALTRGLMLEREVQKLQAKAMLESPRLFASLSLNQLSPYLEKMKLLTRSQFSSRHDEWNQQQRQLPKSDDDDGSITIIDSENGLSHPPMKKNDSSSSQIRLLPPFSPRPSSGTKSKKRKS